VLEAPTSVENAGALVATGYSIDSRTAAPGELFLRYAASAWMARFCDRGIRAGRRGGGGVARARLFLPDAALAHALLIAEDPLVALQSLAAHVRRQWGRLVIAVTGSAGKTTTKDAVGAALGAKFNVLKSRATEQRVRAAAAIAAPHAGTRIRGRRDGHESRGRDCGPGAHRHAGLGRDYQRGHGAH